jgi:hypothetical protein
MMRGGRRIWRRGGAPLSTEVRQRSFRSSVGKKKRCGELKLLLRFVSVRVKSAKIYRWWNEQAIFNGTEKEK